MSDEVTAGDKVLVLSHGHLEETWAYPDSDGLHGRNVRLTPDTRGLTWARGWNTREADALRVADALTDETQRPFNRFQRIVLEEQVGKPCSCAACHRDGQHAPAGELSDEWAPAHLIKPIVEAAIRERDEERRAEKPSAEKLPTRFELILSNDE